jgi:outer membrane protein TolC
MRRLFAAALRARVPLVLLFITLAAAPAAAQQPPRQEPPARQLTLSLDEAVRLALEHNLDLVVQRLEPGVASARVSQAQSAYLPVLGSTVLRNSQVEPPSSFLVGSSGVTTKYTSVDVGLGQRLPWLGTSYSVAWEGTNTSSSSVFTNFNPALGSSLVASVSQPLLRDLGIDTARQQLIVSKRNQGITDTRLRETVVQTVNTVKKAYWDLVASNASVGVQRQSLALADELVRQDRARVEAGQLPELDLLAAQADATQRQEAVTVAEIGQRQSEDRLRTLILDPGQPDFWTTRVMATEPAPVTGSLPDVGRAVTRALQGREDLKRARLELENARTNTRYFANQRLPDLRVQASYQAVGLSGTQLVRTGGFPGTVTGSESTAFTGALRQLFARDFPTWTVGFTFSYPIGRSYEDAGLAASRLQESQAVALLHNLEMQAVRQVREAGWQLEMNARRMETSRAARDLAERRLDAEQKRFGVGMSTSFLVLQAQRDLAQARNNELSAVLDYTRSLADFDALQEASPAQPGATVTVSGSSVAGTTLTGGVVPGASMTVPGATIGQGTVSPLAAPAGAATGTTRTGGQ